MVSVLCDASSLAAGVLIASLELWLGFTSLVFAFAIFFAILAFIAVAAM